MEKARASSTSTFSTPEVKKVLMCCVVRQARVAPPRLNGEGAGQQHLYIQHPRGEISGSG
jgi:hypothetical protein